MLPLLTADADMECDLIDQMRVLMRSRGVLIFNVTEGNNGTYQCAAPQPTPFVLGSCYWFA